MVQVSALANILGMEQWNQFYFLRAMRGFTRQLQPARRISTCGRWLIPNQTENAVQVTPTVIIPTEQFSGQQTVDYTVVPIPISIISLAIAVRTRYEMKHKSHGLVHCSPYQVYDVLYSILLYIVIEWSIYARQTYYPRTIRKRWWALTITLCIHRCRHCKYDLLDTWRRMEQYPLCIR